MAYREKLAWLNLIAMTLAYAVYFGLVGPAITFGRNRLIDILIGFGSVAIAHAILVLLGRFILWLSATRLDRSRADERDLAIDRHGASYGYLILIGGLVWVGVVMPFHAPPWLIINSALAVIVAGEFIKYSFILFSYRRGWHG